MVPFVLKYDYYRFFALNIPKHDQYFYRNFSFGTSDIGLLTTLPRQIFYRNFFEIFLGISRGLDICSYKTNVPITRVIGTFL